MTKVMITFEDGTTHDIMLSDTAINAVRFKFNPSGLATVNILKALAAAFLTECEEQTTPASGRSFACAKTNAEQASMWAVHGATMGV